RGAPQPGVRLLRRISAGDDLPLRRDDAGVEAGEVQAAVEAGVLDLDAAVHDDVEARVLRDLRRLLVPRAELQPQRLRAHRDGLAGDARQILVAAEDIDDVGHDGQVGERGIRLLAEDLVGARVHEVHVERRTRQQVGAYEVARARRVVRSAHDRDALRAAQDPEARGGVRALPGSTRVRGVGSARRGQRARVGGRGELAGVAHRVSPVAMVRAWSRSHTMSSGSSRPTEMRMRSAGTPAASSCSGLSCWCVVDAGCSTSVRASPTFARWLASCSDSIVFSPVARAAARREVSSAYSPEGRTPKAKTEPGPSGRYSWARALCGCSSSPDHVTNEMRGSDASHSATTRAFATCASMRWGRVSTPCRSVNADCALRVGPMSRSCSLRSFVRKPYSPKLSHQRMPPYDGTGSVMVGKRPLPQSNVPASTTMPPSVEPCPPRNFVT